MANASRIQIISMAEGTALVQGTNVPAVGATAFVYQHLTTTQVSVFASETGGSTITQPLVADSNGEFQGWVAGGQDLDIAVTYVGGATVTAQLEPVISSNSSGFANPMTADGDLIVGGVSPAGTPTRLPAGSNTQVLTMVSGVPTWQAPTSGGMTNPMTTAGDLIVGGSSGSPTRLGVASASYSSLRSIANVPVWVGPERIPLFPSGDTTGVMDDTNFNAACTRLDGLGGNPAGGEIVLVGDYNNWFYTANSAGTYTSTGWSPPGQVLASGAGGAVCIQGAGIAVLSPVGSAKTGIYYHGLSQTGSNDYFKGGYVRDVIVDFTNATGASIGFDIGDIIGCHVRGAVRDPAPAGGGTIGANFQNRVFFTEKGHFEIETFNCDTAAQTAGSGAKASHEYNVYDLVVHGVGLNGSGNSLNQTGFVLNAPLGRCRVYIRGNMISTQSTTAGSPTGNAALLAVIGANGASMFRCFMIIGAEINSYSGTGSVTPFSVYQDGNGGSISNCSGHINIANGFTTWQANGDEHSFNGPVTFSQQPHWPASGSFTAITVAAGVSNKNPQSGTTSPATWQNNGLPAQVFVSGSAVTGASIDGVAIPGSAPFVGYVPPESTLSISFTGSTLSNVDLTVIRAAGGGT